MSKLRGLQRLENFKLYHFQDSKVERVAIVAKFETLSFSGYQGCESCKGWKISDFIFFSISTLRGLQRLQNFRLYHSHDIKVARVARLQNLTLYRFQDIKVSKVAKVARFQTLSFFGYQGW